MGDEVVDSSIVVGQKRQSNENGSGPPSKKANISETDSVQIKVLIPSAAVGALIGKGGETMRSLKNDTGCRVQMSKNQEVFHGTTERICLIKGKVSSVMVVLKTIQEKIQEKIESNHPSDPFDLKGLDRTKETKLVVPNTSAGMVIGKNGASIKEIRETTTANIQIYPKAGSEEAKVSVERVITVGHESPDVLLNAVQRVVEKVAQDPMHAHTAENTSNISVKNESSTNSTFDLTRSMGGSGSQFTGMANLGNASSTSNWQTQSDMGMNRSFGTTLKFNPLQGTGNTDLLNFLDNLQMTLRNSGFNDSSVGEIMQAMQILAKYNIMGLGLGLGVAAIAQLRNTESQAIMQQQQQASLMPQTTHPPPQRYDLTQSSLVGTGMTSIIDGVTSADQVQKIGSSSSGVLIDVLSQNSTTNFIGASNYVNTLVKERSSEEGQLDLEVPDSIIGAVLGPRAKTLVEIQQLSGCKIEVHKRGQASTSNANGRLISLTGDNNSILNGRLMIEKIISQEQQRRLRTSTSLLGTSSSTFN